MKISNVDPYLKCEIMLRRMNFKIHSQPIFLIVNVQNPPVDTEKTTAPS